MSQKELIYRRALDEMAQLDPFKYMSQWFVQRARQAITDADGVPEPARCQCGAVLTNPSPGRVGCSKCDYSVELEGKPRC